MYEINPTSKILDSFIYCSAENVELATASFHNFNINIHTFQPLVDLSLHEELKQIPKQEHSRFASLLFERKFEGVNRNQIYFTDGSFCENIAGFGVYNINLAHFFKLQSPCSIFIAELIALYFSCSLISECDPNLYIICSDSLSCLNALNSMHLNFKTHIIFLDLKNILYDLFCRGFLIKFVWVPAHCNIYGNEQADSLAKLGVHSGIIFNRKFHASEFFPKLNEYCLNNWQNVWDSSDKGRWCHSICPKVNKIAWFKNLSISRNMICTFSRIISNHYICNSHLYRINIKDSNLCDCGDFYEDIDHIVFVCHRFELPRKRFFCSLNLFNHSIPESVRDILGRKCLPIMKLLFEFLNEISYAV